MKNEILSMDELDAVVGGTADEAQQFRALAVEKGWAKSMTGMAGGMAANRMLQEIGIPHVNWHVKDDAPADFWDNSGNHYDFDTVMAKLKLLPDKK